MKMWSKQFFAIIPINKRIFKENIDLVKWIFSLLIKFDLGNSYYTLKTLDIQTSDKYLSGL